MFALRKDGGAQKWSRFASHPSVDFFQWHSGAEGATALLASPCWAGEEKDEEAEGFNGGIEKKYFTCHS